MSLRRICDRCGINEFIDRDELPKGWLRLTAQNRAFEVCAHCRSAYLKFIENLVISGEPL